MRSTEITPFLQGLVAFLAQTPATLLRLAAKRREDSVSRYTAADRDDIEWRVRRVQLASKVSDEVGR